MLKPKGIDKVLLSTVLILLIFGLVMIASSGVVYSKTRFGDEYYFFKRQLWGIGIGSILLLVIQKIDYSLWKRFSFLAFVFSLVLLILVFIPGMGFKIYGATRWLQLGPISFQPSEILKLSLIIYLAAWLEAKKEKVRDFFDGTVPFLIILGIVSFLLIKQPDVGTLGIIILISVSVFFVAGVKLRHMLAMALFGLLAFFLIIKLEPYRMDRITTFLHPELDPQGVGYQINQALLAIGSGGFFGRGLGHSLQKFNYLPEPVGDSIFAIIGEELGLIGGLFVLILFLIFVLRGFRIAKNAPDTFSKLVAVGITSWIFFQAFINIAAISGLLPLTGVPLPFISYGGTSIVFLLIGVGILLNISKQNKIRV